MKSSADTRVSVLLTQRLFTPPPKSGDTTSDCQHIVERRKAKTQEPGAVIQHSLYFCSFPPSPTASESRPALSERHGNPSLTGLKQDPSFRALFLMLKKGLSTSILHHTKSKEELDPEFTLLFPHPTLRCSSAFASHFPAAPLLLIVANTPERTAGLLRKRH